MTSRVLQSSEIIPFPSALDACDSAAAAYMSHLRRATLRTLEAEIADRIADEQGNFLRGVVFALAVEAGAALCLLGVWRLWQMVR